MKKLLFFVVITIFLGFTLSACSGEKNKKYANGQVKEESYIDKYDKEVRQYTHQMSEILIAFNNAMDGIYTQQLSREQFKNILTQTIGKSNELVTAVESETIEPEIFDSHQQFILLVNRTHQLLLDAIDMANNTEQEIDKETLRSDYLSIKTDQATFVNSWKTLKEQLEKGKNGK